MEEKFISIGLFWLGIAWVIFTIMSNYGTTCFNMFYAYITILVLLSDMIWSNFIVKK